MANKYLEKIANDVSQKKKRHENAVLTGALGVVGAHQGSKRVAGLIGRSSLEDLGKAEPYLRPDLGTSYLKDHDLDVVARRKARSFSRKPTGGTSFAYSAVHGMGPQAVAYGLGRRLRTAKLEHRKAVEESKGLQKTASNQEVSTPVPQPNLTRETLKNMGTDMAFSLPASAVGAGLGVVGAHSLAQGSMKGAASDLWNSAKKKVSGLRMSKGMGKAGLVASLPLIGYEMGGHVGSYFGRRHHLQRMEAQQAKPM